jgi:hypothetical protein
VFVAIMAVLSSLVGATRASAQKPPVLVVTRGAGAEDCPDAVALGQLVWTLGQRRVTTTTDRPSELVVHVAIERNTAGYAAVLHARGSQQGTRTLADVGPTCQSLAEALAMVIAIMLDAPATPRNAPVSEPAAPMVSDTWAPSGVAPRSGKRAEWHLGLEALGGVAVAVLSDPVALGGGGATLRLGERVEFGLGGLRLQRDWVTMPGGEVTLDLTAAYLRGCAAVTDNEAVALQLCAALLLGSLRGEGQGYPTYDTKRVPWTVIGLGPAGVGTLGGGTSWWLAATALMPLVRHGFSVEVEGQEQRFRLDDVGLLFTMGLRIGKDPG